jgi:5-methylcytosine-specific restriction protein A
MLQRGERQGRPHVEINAGELHRVIGGYPGAGEHRMPMCCQAMLFEKRASDEIVFEPPKGKGASLTIRYRLPR